MPGLPDECAQLTHETVGRATFSFPSPLPHPCPTAIELRRNGFLPLLIVILLLISKNLSRARLRLGLRLGACPCGGRSYFNGSGAGERRAFFISFPSLQLSPRSFLAGREGKKPSMFFMPNTPS